VVGGVVIGLAATGAAVWTVFRGTGTTLSNRGDAPTAPQDLDSIRSAAEAATARFAIDNAGELSVNGQVVGENRDWSWANEVDLTPHLTVG
jgi:hypothetical protein